MDVHISVCMYVCMYVCTYVCTYVSMYLHTYACMKRVNACITVNAKLKPRSYLMMNEASALKGGLKATKAYT